MPDLREQLEQCLQGRVCLIGLGNVDYGDDGFGVRLAEALDRSPDAFLPVPARRMIITAGTAPERVVGRVADAGFDHVIFLDAVDFGGLPGAAVFLNSREVVARFPQISTHKLSLGLLAQRLETNGRTKAWLLGVQPESLKPGKTLSRAVRTSLDLLRQLVLEAATEVTA